MRDSEVKLRLMGYEWSYAPGWTTCLKHQGTVVAEVHPRSSDAHSCSWYRVRDNRTWLSLSRQEAMEAVELQVLGLLESGVRP